MLNGQETIQELIKRYPQAKKVLANFGIEESSKFKNVVEAALSLKIPLAQVLYALSKATGDKIQEPKVSGLRAQGLQRGLKKGIPVGVKRVIAVHSGKGGVGKTFVTVNLAAFLVHCGFKVGILDADIDCPNVLLALGMEGKLVANASKKIVPLYKNGLQVVSMASVEEMMDKAILWRGPVISKVIEQFVQDTEWDELDFLLVDLPPGTSDAPLSVLQILEGAEVLVVTTGQKLALLDAKKSIGMCRELGAPILGVIENMSERLESGNTADQLKPEGSVAKTHAAQEFAQKENCLFLGSIPFKADYAQLMDEGQPAVLSDPKLREIFESLRKFFSKEHNE